MIACNMDQAMGMVEPQRGINQVGRVYLDQQDCPELMVGLVH